MKTPKVKKREVSLHSRAARRGTAPPAKDLTVKAPAIETDYKPWLHGAQNAGIGKRKKVKQLSRQQKVRQQRALEKADATVDKLERKVAVSKARGRKVQARAIDWEELNDMVAGKKKRVGELVPTLDVSSQTGSKDSAKLDDDAALSDHAPSTLTTALAEGLDETHAGPEAGMAASEEDDHIT